MDSNSKRARLDSDPQLGRYKNNIKQVIRDLIAFDEVIDDGQSAEDYNPVDYVHVSKQKELDPEEYES